MHEKFIAQRISLLRNNKNISARELSLRLGQSEGYINSIENGKSNPSVLMLKYICDELGVALSEFYDAGNKYPDLIQEIIRECKRLDRESLEGVLSVLKNMGKK